MSSLRESSRWPLAATEAGAGLFKTRAVEFIKRNASSGKPFSPTSHSPSFTCPHFRIRNSRARPGNGDWADCLAEMDYRTGQILDAIKERGIEDNTIVIFTSDNGPEATHPWEGDSGPWRGTYFTAMEASLRAFFYPLARQDSRGAGEQ
jgi:arylsulfatase